ncbi:conjugal transfer protein [Streptomyces sp. NPDC048384]|uniref:conjugal transfer protein n=1 Tax=Streptomyces sp. NPDC048384 TaxID=3155487 RepID=UPI0034381B03
MPPSLPGCDQSGPPRRESAPSSPAAPRTRALPVRRTRLVRAAVWAAVAAGPLSLIASCTRDEPAAHTQPAPVTRAADHPQASADPTGYAELILGLWLRAGSGEDSTAARQLRALAPSVQLPVWGEHTPDVERLAAVRTAPQSDTAWSVTVAVQFKSPVADSGEQGLVRYFALPVIATGAGTAPGTREAFAITAAPAEVAGPTVLDEPDDPYDTQVPTGSALASTVEEFLTAYLGAEEGAERYLAPGTTLPAPTSAAFTTVTAEELQAADRTDGTVGKDGATVRVQARITARDASGGQWPLTYALKLTARDGRWEVVALQSGLEDTATTKTSSSRTGTASTTRTAATVITSIHTSSARTGIRVAGWEVTR